MKFLSRYLVLISVVVLIFNQSIPAVFKIHYPRSFGPSFSSGIRGDYLERIDQEKPEAILLGNSIQVLAMDEILFGSITKMQTLQFASPGAASAQYYLMIKNVITAGNLHPKYVILFFLNNLLTEPDLCVDGENYQKIIDEIATDNEPVLIQKAYINPSNPLSVWLDSNIPVLGERQSIKSKMDNKLKYSLPEIFLNCDRACLDENLDMIFVSENMNNVLETGQDGEWRGKDWEFNSLVNDSFLPDIIQLLQEKKITLVLVRQKDTRIMNLEDETKDMHEYFNNLQSYLKKNSIALIDISHDPSLTKEMYFDFMHIKQAEKPFYTNLIAQRFLNLK